MHNIRPYIRLVLFILGVIFLNYILSWCLIPAEEGSRITLYEASNEKYTHDLVVFGASEAHADWNTNIANEILGLDTFNMGGTAAKLDGGIYAQFQNYMKYQDPSIVVFLVGRNDLGDDDESPAVFVHTAPYMRSRTAAIEYYFRTIFKDTFYKSFPWNTHHVYSLSELKDNIQRKTSSEYLEYKADWIPVEDFKYQGKGYYEYQGVIQCDNVKGLGSFSTIRNSFSVGKHAEALEKMVTKCVAENRKVVILLAPTPDMEIASLGFYPYYSDWLKEFAKEKGAFFYDMNYAVKELWDRQDSMFSDVAHLNGVGADSFTEAVCKVLQKQEKGESTDELFYSWEEYVHSIDHVVAIYNEMFENENNQKYLKANSIVGADIQIEYSFVLYNIYNDKKEVLQDFCTNDTIELPREVDSGDYKVRVYARKKNEQSDDGIRFCDYPMPE